MVVELPGVQDQQRGHDIVKEPRNLQMQIGTSRSVGQVLPLSTRILKAKGWASPQPGTADADSQQRGRAVALHECHADLRQDCRRHHEVRGRSGGTSHGGGP